jgi:hypothetical protein
VSLYELARFMCTSVGQIDGTYGHLLPDSIERARVAMDTFASGVRPEDEAQDGRRDEKPAGFQRVPHIGAPRFELGTSSPPDW